MWDRFLTIVLAQLKTKCSEWAFLIGLCPSSVNRPSSVNNCLQNISETTGPNSMTSWEAWLTLYKNTTKHWDWTTKWPTYIFALKNISETTRPISMKLYRKLHCNNIIFCKQNISYTTVPNLMQLHWKLPGLTLYQKIQRMQLITNKMSDFLFCIKKHLLWTY